jgi:hypothetical protein
MTKGNMKCKRNNKHNEMTEMKNPPTGNVERVFSGELGVGNNLYDMENHD